MTWVVAFLGMQAASELWGQLVRPTLVLAAGAALGALFRRAEPELRHRLWVGTLFGTLVTGLAPWLAELMPWRLLGAAAIRAPAWLGEEIAVPASAIWLAGALILAARVGAGTVAGRRLAARARPLVDPEWQSALGQAALDLGVRAPVRLCESGATRVPLTLGIRQPVVVLPAGCDAWTPARRRAVLLHELAHVARGDLVTELFVRAMCALYWLHPGVWWVTRRLRLAREQACDAEVVGTGTPAAEYAEHLVDLLRSASVLRPGAAGIGLGSRSTLEERLVWLSRVPASRRVSATRAMAGLLPVAAGVALALWAPPARAASGKASVGVAAASTKPACDCRHKAKRVGQR